MTIAFGNYSGGATSQATSLSGMLPAPTGRVLASGVDAVPVLLGRFGRPYARLAVGNVLSMVAPAPTGRLWNGTAGLFAIAPRPTFIAASATAPLTGSLYGAARSALFTATAGYKMTGTLYGVQPVTGLLVQSGVNTLRGRAARAKSVMTGQLPVVNHMSLVPALYEQASAQGVWTNTIFDLTHFADVQAAQFVQALLSLFQATDTYAELVAALQAMHDGLSLHDLAALLYRAQLVDAFIAHAVQVGTAQLTVLLAEEIVFSEHGSALTHILQALYSGVHLSLALNTGDDIYTAWVMTPESKAIRSYSNFPFNSFATLGDQYLAASTAGVYQMGGTTDAGQAIIARVRSGLKDFGTRRLKRIDRAYVGYASNGTLCMRVCATTATGDKTEYTYKMVEQAANAPREGRILVGRGVRSVYWSFELCNDATSSNFELYDITVLPMVLTGRVI